MDREKIVERVAAPDLKYEGENILAAVDRGETIDANHPYIASLRAVIRKAKVGE